MDRSLREIGAWCAVLTTVAFVLGIVLMASSGVETLIPDTGDAVLDWVDQVNGAGGTFYAGGWLIVLGGLLAMVALACFYDVFRPAGQLLVLAPVLAVASLTMVTISHLVPIAMGYRLVPGYLDGDAATRASLVPVLDTFASVSLVVNFVGDIILWGVVVPLYALASLKTRIVARWIGWVGLVTAAFGGWLGLLSPASDVIEGFTFIGFLAFFVWIGAMGVALLRHRAPVGLSAD
jgi:hypothetical protein